MDLLRPVVLLGPPGAGKSSVGERAARRLNVPFVDLDERIGGSAGRPAGEVLAEEGELSFRIAELRELARALNEPPSIIAAGSGVIGTLGARTLLRRRARGVWLDVDAAEAERRLARDDTARPLLAGPGSERMDPARWQALVAEREGHWRSLSQERLDTTTLALDAAAEQLAALVRRPDRPVVPGALPEVVRMVTGTAPHPLVRDGREIALVLDAGVPASEALSALLHALEGVSIVTVPGGEATKTFERAHSLARELVARRFPPDGLLIAAGGGATLDLSGFVAATLFRGVRWAAVPTTLLAMLDACLGGKTAVDLPEGKNLLGAFHSPSLIVVDPGFLTTLPARERSAGVVEALKHAFLAADAPEDGSPGLEDEALPRLASGLATAAETEQLLRRSLSLKAAVVDADPEERGLRAVLNLGHTLGHALEHESAAIGEALLHGEAVAHGLRFALCLSEAAAGLSSEVAERLMARVDELRAPSPARLPHDALIQRMALDKKRRGHSLRFVALAGPGRPVLLRDLPDELVRSCLQRALAP